MCRGDGGLNRRPRQRPHQDDPTDALVLDQRRQGPDVAIGDVQRAVGEVDVALVADLFDAVEDVRVEGIRRQRIGHGAVQHT